MTQWASKCPHPDRVAKCWGMCAACCSRDYREKKLKDGARQLYYRHLVDAMWALAKISP